MGFDFLKRSKKAAAGPAAEGPASSTAASASGAGRAAAGAAAGAPEAGAPGADEGLRVFSMGPSQEMRYAVELLTSKGLHFESVDVTADPGLQSWVRQKTGSAEYPQIFLGRKSLGDYGAIRRLDVEGNLDRVLAGLPPVELRTEETLEVGSTSEVVRTRLRRGDVLSLTTPDGETFDAWAEVFANPPQIYYRGEPLPIDNIETVIAEITELLADPGTDAAWSTGK